MTNTQTPAVGLHQAQFDPTGSTLVKQAVIITGTDRGTIRGDILLRDGRIADVAENLDVTDAEVVDGSKFIVTPGFVDTHRHLWLSMFKGMSYDSHLAEVFANLYGVYAPGFRPEDHYSITALARLAALDAGVTTMLDWAHNITSPEDEDAAIAALRDVGGRTVFGHGFGAERMFDAERYYDTARPAEAAERTRKLLPDDDALISPAYLALEPPALISMNACKKEFQIARDLGLRISIHILSTDENYQPAETLKAMHAEGLMGEDVTWVHLTGATDDEFRLIADTGGSASVSPHVDSHFHSPPPTGRLLAAGVRPSLSIDSANASSEDFFSQMRVAFDVERAITTSQFEARPEGYRLSMSDVFEFATLQGARALGKEHQIGTIEAGKDADLLFIRTDSPNMTPLLDPLNAVVYHANISDIDTVLVQGKPVKRDGRLLADVPAAISRVENSADHLFWSGDVEVTGSAEAHPAARPVACL
jgi:cytosine/adenosine deaminase-related metal-dependent hydrolase